MGQLLEVKEKVARFGGVTVLLKPKKTIDDFQRELGENFSEEIEAREIFFLPITYPLCVSVKPGAEKEWSDKISTFSSVVLAEPGFPSAKYYVEELR